MQQQLRRIIVKTSKICDHKMNKLTVQEAIGIASIVTSFFYLLNTVINASLYYVLQKSYWGLFENSGLDYGIWLWIKLYSCAFTLFVLLGGGFTFFWVVYLCETIITRIQWLKKKRKLLLPIMRFEENILKDISMILAIVIASLFIFLLLLDWGTYSKFLWSGALLVVGLFFIVKIVKKVIHSEYNALYNVNILIMVELLCTSGMCLAIFGWSVMEVEPKVISDNLIGSKLQFNYISTNRLIVGKSCISYIEVSSGKKLSLCNLNNEFCYEPILADKFLLRNYSKYIRKSAKDVNTPSILLLDLGNIEYPVNLNRCGYVDFQIGKLLSKPTKSNHEL